MSRSVTFPTGETLALVDATPCIVVHTPPAGRYGPGPWALQGLGGSLTRRPEFVARGWCSMPAAQSLEVQAEMLFAGRLNTGIGAPTVGETWHFYNGEGGPLAVVAFEDAPARSSLLAWTAPPPDLAWFPPAAAPASPGWHWCMVDPDPALDTLDELWRRPLRRAPNPYNPWPGDRVGLGASVGVRQGPMRARAFDGRFRWWPRTLGGIPVGDVLSHPHHLLPDAA